MTKSAGTIAECFVPGRPVVPSGDLVRRSSSDVWTRKVIDVTSELDRVTGPCELEVEFVLVPDPDMDPWENPWEMATEHLLKWLLDALGQTVLRPGPEKEIQIVAICARGRAARPGEKTGAHIAIRRAKVPR
jgi:hypothetical protein